MLNTGSQRNLYLVRVYIVPLFIIFNTQLKFLLALSFFTCSLFKLQQRCFFFSCSVYTHISVYTHHFNSVLTLYYLTIARADTHAWFMHQWNKFCLNALRLTFPAVYNFTDKHLRQNDGIYITSEIMWCICCTLLKYIYTGGTKLSINLVLLASFANLYHQNSFTIKLISNVCLKGFIMICVKFRSDCCLRINWFYVFEKYWKENTLTCDFMFFSFKVPYANTYCYNSFSLAVFL